MSATPNQRNNSTAPSSNLNPLLQEQQQQQSRQTNAKTPEPTTSSDQNNNNNNNNNNSNYTPPSNHQPARSASMLVLPQSGNNNNSNTNNIGSLTPGGFGISVTSIGAASNNSQQQQQQQQQKQNNNNNNFYNLPAFPRSNTHSTFTRTTIVVSQPNNSNLFGDSSTQQQQQQNNSRNNTLSPPNNNNNNINTNNGLLLSPNAQFAMSSTQIGGNNNNNNSNNRNNNNNNNNNSFLTMSRGVSGIYLSGDGSSNSNNNNNDQQVGDTVISNNQTNNSLRIPTTTGGRSVSPLAARSAQRNTVGNYSTVGSRNMVVSQSLSRNRKNVTSMTAPGNNDNNDASPGSMMRREGSLYLGATNNNLNSTTNLPASLTPGMSWRDNSVTKIGGQNDTGLISPSRNLISPGRRVADRIVKLSDDLEAGNNNSNSNLKSPSAKRPLEIQRQEEVAENNRLKSNSSERAPEIREGSAANNLSGATNRESEGNYSRVQGFSNFSFDGGVAGKLASAASNTNISTGDLMTPNSKTNVQNNKINDDDNEEGNNHRVQELPETHQTGIFTSEREDICADSGSYAKLTATQLQAHNEIQERNNNNNNIIPSTTAPPSPDHNQQRKNAINQNEDNSNQQQQSILRQRLLNLQALRDVEDQQQNHQTSPDIAPTANGNAFAKQLEQLSFLNQQQDEDEEEAEEEEEEQEDVVADWYESELLLTRLADHRFYEEKLRIIKQQAEEERELLSIQQQNQLQAITSSQQSSNFNVLHHHNNHQVGNEDIQLHDPHQHHIKAVGDLTAGTSTTTHQAPSTNNNSPSPPHSTAGSYKHAPTTETLSVIPANNNNNYSSNNNCILQPSMPGSESSPPSPASEDNSNNIIVTSTATFHHHHHHNHHNQQHHSLLPRSSQSPSSRTTSPSKYGVLPPPPLQSSSLGNNNSTNPFFFSTSPNVRKFAASADNLPPLQIPRSASNSSTTNHPALSMTNMSNLPVFNPGASQNNVELLLSAVAATSQHHQQQRQRRGSWIANPNILAGGGGAGLLTSNNNSIVNNSSLTGSGLVARENSDHGSASPPTPSNASYNNITSSNSIQQQQNQQQQQSPTSGVSHISSQPQFPNVNNNNNKSVVTVSNGSITSAAVAVAAVLGASSTTIHPVLLEQIQQTQEQQHRQQQAPKASRDADVDMRGLAAANQQNLEVIVHNTHQHLQQFLHSPAASNNNSFACGSNGSGSNVHQHAHSYRPPSSSTTNNQINHFDEQQPPVTNTTNEHTENKNVFADVDENDNGELDAPLLVIVQDDDDNDTNNNTSGGLDERQQNENGHHKMEYGGTGGFTIQLPPPVTSRYIVVDMDAEYHRYSRKTLQEQQQARNKQRNSDNSTNNNKIPQSSPFFDAAGTEVNSESGMHNHDLIHTSTALDMESGEFINNNNKDGEPPKQQQQITNREHRAVSFAAFADSENSHPEPSPAPIKTEDDDDNHHHQHDEPMTPVILTHSFRTKHMEGVPELADPEDEGGCCCSEAEIHRFVDRYDVDALDFCELLSECTVCHRRPATFISLHDLKAACPSHVPQLVQRSDNPDENTLFVCTLDIATAYDRIFWCEKCQTFTWKYTDPYSYFIDSIVKKRRPYLKQPCTDVFVQHYQISDRFGATAQWRPIERPHHNHHHHNHTHSSHHSSPTQGNGVAGFGGSKTNNANLPATSGSHNNSRIASRRGSAQVVAGAAGSPPKSPNTENEQQHQTKPETENNNNKKTNKHNQENETHLVSAGMPLQRICVTMTSTQGWRSTQEDAEVVFRVTAKSLKLPESVLQCSPATDFVVLGVFDGHGGDAVAKIAASNIEHHFRFALHNAIIELRQEKQSQMMLTRTGSQVLSHLESPAKDLNLEHDIHLGVIPGGSSRTGSRNTRDSNHSNSNNNNPTVMIQLLGQDGISSTTTTPTHTGNTLNNLQNQPFMTMSNQGSNLSGNVANNNNANNNDGELTEEEVNALMMQGAFGGGDGLPPRKRKKRYDFDDFGGGGGGSPAGGMMMMNNNNNEDEGIQQQEQQDPTNAFEKILPDEEDDGTTSQGINNMNNNHGKSNNSNFKNETVLSTDDLDHNTINSAADDDDQDFVLSSPESRERLKFFKKVLTNTFYNLDKAIEHTPEHLDFQSYGMIGTTACVVVITEEDIVCASAGDSRACLFNKHHKKVIPLSHDHKLSVPKERARIESAGYSIRNNRIEGLLAVPRALGDFDFKMNGAGGQGDQAVTAKPTVRLIPRSDLRFGAMGTASTSLTAHPLMQPVESAEDDASQNQHHPSHSASPHSVGTGLSAAAAAAVAPPNSHIIVSEETGHRFYTRAQQPHEDWMVLIGCDGIWDALTNEEACDIADTIYDEGVRSSYFEHCEKVNHRNVLLLQAKQEQLALHLVQQQQQQISKHTSAQSSPRNDLQNALSNFSAFGAAAENNNTNADSHQHSVSGTETPSTTNNNMLNNPQITFSGTGAAGLLREQRKRSQSPQPGVTPTSQQQQESVVANNDITTSSSPLSSPRLGQNNNNQHRRSSLGANHPHHHHHQITEQHVRRLSLQNRQLQIQQQNVPPCWYSAALYSNTINDVIGDSACGILRMAMATEDNPQEESGVGMDNMSLIIARLATTG